MTDSPRERVVELAKRRGFFFPSAEAYGGVAGFWTYGPAGAALKRNVEDRWRDRFVIAEGNREIDAPTILPEPVFEASGHLRDFTDMIVECPACGRAHRADHLLEATGEVADAEALAPGAVAEHLADLGVTCPRCGADLAGESVEEFNLMFATTIGPGDGQPGYLRPETAQATLVDAPRLLEYARNQLPFGVVQVGRAYRNEISPRRSVIRVREMTQAELEYFVDPEGPGPDLARVGGATLRLYPVGAQRDASGRYRELSPAAAVEAGVIDAPWLAYFLGVTDRWLRALGVDPERLRFRQHLPDERAHYARDCWDAEVDLGGDWVELAGLADRGQYDLHHHAEASGEDYTVFRPYDEARTVERATVDPDMATLGPDLGSAAPRVVEALERLAAE
ncbi:MAG: glycine--tRNA ligase, partial [Halobacteriales archaeon]